MICPEGCHLCCLETEMILTESDVRRLEALGYRREDFSEFRDGFVRLKNVDGRCYFLRNGRCQVYEHRPQGCRAYPVVFDLDRGTCSLDTFCPATHTVTEAEFREGCSIVRGILRDVGILKQ